MKEKAILDHEISQDYINDKYIYKLKKFEDLEEGEIIPLISDTIFDYLINNESKKEYAASIISAALDLDYDKVYNSIEFKSPRLKKDKVRNSKKTVDLLCEVDGVLYNIEINNKGYKSSLERNIQYIADIFESKMMRGGKYKYQNAVQININNFSFKGRKKIMDIISLRSNEGDLFTDKIKIIHIYLL